MKEKLFHVISNTHWDREWRFPFQRNRQMLVDMIDSVIEILETEPDYKAFHLDSQSIVIKDYLEIRPQNKDRFIKLVKEKRLLIGPWYILPEEYEVGGENLIRNLLLGHRVCQAHGGVSKIGYSPFSWGQISQLPQIYKEFGINLIMFYRGINSLDSPKAEFLWEGADGSQSISSRFSTMPRYNFYFYIYRPVIHNEGFYDVEYKWSKGGTPFHFIDKEQSSEDFFIIEPLDEYYSDNIEPQVKAIIKDQAEDFTTKNVIWMEGHDSSGPNKKTINIIKDINKNLPNVKVIHSTLEDYAKALYKEVDEKKLKLVKGERRSAQYDRRSANLYGYTTSARMFLKQKNFEAERWLQFYAEPFNIFSALIGKNINDRYLDIAWNFLIQNSAHDSIGGCSLDEIHDDMMNRYKQSIEISKGVFERSIKHLVKQIDTSVFRSDNKEKNSEIYITAINPNNYLRNEIVETFIDIPKEFDKDFIQINNKDGKRSKVQLIKKADHQPVIEQMIDRPMYFDMKRYHAYIELTDIPKFGYKTYQVKPVKAEKSKTNNIIKTKNNLPVLENEFIKVKINSNGTFNVNDKLNSKVYKNLGYFYDEGEAGHAWVIEPTKPFVDTLKSKAKIKVEENGELIGSCSIQHKIKIHANLKERKSGSKKFVKVPIQLFLSIDKNSKRVNIKVNVDNTAESHRLRIMFPTNLKATHSYGEGQFDVVQRSLERPDTKDWVEQPMYDFPMHQFVDLTDGKNGAAIIVNGLKEYEVLNDKKRTLAITLFRAFEYIIAPSSRQDYTHQKGSQCLGKSSYEMSFYPHKGDWIEGEVYKEALNYNNNVRIVQTGKTNGKLSDTLSLMEVTPDELIFSALKKSEDESSNVFILRLYNPTDKKLKGSVNFAFDLANADQVTLEEKQIEGLQIMENRRLKIEVNRKQIVTIKLKFK